MWRLEAVGAASAEDAIAAVTTKVVNECILTVRCNGKRVVYPLVIER